MNVQQKYAQQANCKVYKIRRILISKNIYTLKKGLWLTEAFNSSTNKIGKLLPTAET
jgi:hypothetical protein